MNSEGCGLEPTTISDVSISVLTYERRNVFVSLYFLRVFIVLRSVLSDLSNYFNIFPVKYFVELNVFSPVSCQMYPAWSNKKNLLVGWK